MVTSPGPLATKRNPLPLISAGEKLPVFKSTEIKPISIGLAVLVAILIKALHNPFTVWPKQDILTAPNSAIKTQGNSTYVEMFDTPMAIDNQGVLSNTLPKKQSVQIGEANDTLTEIISGLKENDQIIVRTITTATTTTTSLLNSGGGSNPLRALH